MDETRATKATDTDHRKDAGSNPDPITGAPGAHPVGTGAGAMSGGLVGAASGAIMGPVGAVVGAAVGAIAGALVGKGLAEAINPTAEEAFWKESYVREPYYEASRNYDYYAPAYRTGWEGRARFEGRTFDDVERDLRTHYEQAVAEHGPNWEEGRLAARAAWDRIDQIRTTSR